MKPSTGENLGRPLSNGGGGPRVTTGEDSKQDYKTPDDFMQAVKKRFGPIQFDLAAHAGNKQHERYFAPQHFVSVGTADELDLHPSVEAAIAVENRWQEGDTTVEFKRFATKGRKKIYEKRVVNRDPNAFGFDAFKFSWQKTLAKFKRPDGKPGLGWLNMEFNDGERWSAKCKEEAQPTPEGPGANLLLLSPAVVANWWRDNVAGTADCYLLSGRLCFDGKNVYPKDCCLSHFGPEARGRMLIWEWKADIVHQLWIPEARVLQWE